jgi:putative phosphoesterase
MYKWRNSELVIGVVSDTHRQPQMIKKAVEKLKDVDIIMHLGDNTDDVKQIQDNFNGKVISVKGNCDFNVTAPSELIEVIEGKKFFITHGHNYGVKNDLTRLKYKALEVGADVALFGHTHIPLIIEDEGIYFFNPGSASLSRKGPNSVGVITIENGQIDIKIEFL